MGMMRKNRVFFIILVLVFSMLCLSAVYMPHSMSEANDGYDYDYEAIIRSMTNNKPVSNLRKLLQNLRTFTIKIFRLPQILSYILALANIRIALFDILFSTVQILHLKSVLCFYFHGGKFKDNASTLICCN